HPSGGTLRRAFPTGPYFPDDPYRLSIDVLIELRRQQHLRLVGNDLLAGAEFAGGQDPAVAVPPQDLDFTAFKNRDLRAAGLEQVHQRAALVVKQSGIRNRHGAARFARCRSRQLRLDERPGPPGGESRLGGFRGGSRAGAWNFGRGVALVEVTDELQG